MKKVNSKYTKGHGKIRPWKKGQSCVFNPSFNKHRNAAKKRGAFGNASGSNLTEALVAQHNKMTIDSSCAENENDAMSVGNTALTAFTNCSLPSFNRLLTNWNSGSFLHKEMVAVLAAVTEILQKDGGKETETDYFAALMTTLDVVDTDESITAVICLLAMLVKRVNESVLKAQSKKTCETIMKLLLKYMNSDHCALLKNLLSIIYTFLKIRTNWSESSEDLVAVLEFTTHHKPRVRKKAQQVVQALLNHHIPEAQQVHPCASHVAKFCIKKLESSSGKSKSQDTFYMLQLLQDTLGVMPASSIKECCETIFKVMTLSNAMVTLCALKSLQGLFSSRHKVIPVDLNARIITALYDYQPNVKDSECLISWLQLMNRALTSLYSLDQKLCFSHLPKFFSVATKCWLNNTESVMFTIESTLNNLLESCIDPTSAHFQKMLFDDPVNNDVHRMFQPVAEAMHSYQYQQAWSYILSVLAGFFKAAGKHCYTAMLKCLQALGDLHDSYNFPYVNKLEKTIGVAIENIGPCIVLQTIPLQIDGKRPDFPRSWMLPLLRDHIQKTELQFFVKYFLPLAAKMRNRAVAMKNDGKLVESKLFDVVCSQIWSLLPGFCTEPTDLQLCFKEVAQTLGMVIKNDASLRTTVMNSLRLLINRNMENDKNREEIAIYAKNYLPILFNLYSTKPNDKVEEKVRLAVYETIKIYLQITNKELCSTFFAKAMERLSSESEVFMQHALIDLCKVMVPFLSECQLKELFEFCKPLLQHANKTVQKKAYGVLKEICCSESEACSSFVKAHLQDLRQMLSGSASGLIPSTRALRLACLQLIVSNLTQEEKSTVIEIIPEAVLCTKETSIKARTAAFNLLVEIGKTLLRLGTNSPKDAVKEYLAYLLPGLAGGPHFVSATVLAIGRVIYEFKEQMDSQIIENLVVNMCELVKSQSREIVTSVLSFFKILFITVSTDALAQHVPIMVSSLTSMTADHQRPFRFKSKQILTRLTRKFGYEMMSKLIPENYQKQLTNIRKVEARKKRNKRLKLDDSDSEVGDFKKKSDEFADLLADSDDEMPFSDEEEVKTKPSKSKKKTKAPCIEENPEEDIVDFLDPTVNKRLLTIKSGKGKSQKAMKTNSFPVSDDGRLIIREDSEKSKEKKVQDERSAILSELGATSKKNKRKYEDSDADSVAGDGKISISGVEKGIYRAVEPVPKRKKLPGEEFKAKKAGGDVKRGKIDPYAYLPLNRQTLNKRKQGKLKGQFKHIVKAAKRGANVGSKKKAQQGKKKKH